MWFDAGSIMQIATGLTDTATWDHTKIKDCAVACTRIASRSTPALALSRTASDVIGVPSVPHKQLKDGH